MKLTNITNLPKPVVLMAESMVNNHPIFDNNRYSVTELLKSTRQIVLARRHADAIEMDVQDTYNMWSGTAIHEGLQKQAVDHPELGLVPEKRFELDLGDGLELSGGFDLYDPENKTLYDYKNTKVATFNENVKGREDKWAKQLYLYTLGIEKLFGRKPEKAIIVAMLKDHSVQKAQTESSYPQNPIMMIEWKMEDIEKFSSALSEEKEKAAEVRSYLLSGDEPPLCTYSDCWCIEDWCIKKEGAKRAEKRFDNPDEALEHYEGLSADLKKDRRILHRVSDFKNCKNYCNCRDFCSQWQKNKDFEAFEEDVTDELESGYIPF